MSVEQLTQGSYDSRAAALQRQIENKTRWNALTKAQTAVDYYNYKHDILNNRIFYMDDKGQLVEDRTASNIKIPHPFFVELVDQKVNYLLSNPVQFETEDATLQEELDEYYDAEFQTVIRDALEGASIKSHEYVFARTRSDDRLAFQISDSMETFPVTDENGDTRAIVRHYNREAEIDGRPVTITFAEVWDDQEVTFYKTNSTGVFRFDEEREMNPRKHVVGRDAEGNQIGRSYGTIPFYRLSNNKAETTDLEPVKALIDDYDLMAAFLSNNLQDFADAIYVVKNYPGQSLTELRNNIKSRRMVGVGENGDLEVRTVNIPTEARKLKLEIDKEAIYKFGMGFDSTQALGSNIANVVIRSRYTLLELKANKAENRLRGLLEWINERVIDDINRRKNKNYDPKDVEITIERSIMINEEEDAAVQERKANTQQIEMQTLLAAAARLDDETVLRTICELLELDYDEVEQRLEDQEYTPLLQEDTEPEEDQPEVGGVDKQPAAE